MSRASKERRFFYADQSNIVELELDARTMIAFIFHRKLKMRKTTA